MQPLDQLKKLFYNPKIGLTSYKQLYEKAVENNINVTMKQVKDFYNKQEVNQIFKEKHKPIYIPTSADKVGTLQADLIDMSKLSSHNKNFNWILNVIDVHSRKAWSFPIKTKEPTNVLPAIKQVVADVTEVDKLITDSGGEFKGSVSKYLKDNNITQVFANPSDNTKLRTALVERYHKTLLNKIRKIQDIKGSLNWIDYLDDLTENYNNTIHSSTKAKPNDVFSGKVVLKNTTKNTTKAVEEMLDQFPIVSKVRIQNKLQTFDKRGRENKFSREVYYVIGRENFQFVLMDADGNVLKDYYPAHMLLRVDDVDDGTLVEKEKIATEKRVVKKKQTLNRLQRKEVALGHEAEKIDEQGQIVLKDRLKPKEEKRIRKKTSRMDL